MKAVVLAGSHKHPAVAIETVDKPRDKTGMVVIEVAAAGITKMEPHWITGWQNADGSPKPRPVVIGCEFAGVVASIGLGVSGVSVGERVLGMTGPYDKGAMAQFVSADADDILPLPLDVPFDDAATLGLAGLTAWQALIRYGELKAGQRILIQGGAGGVGNFAIQLARWIGAYVVVTANGRFADLCKRLGADEVIDYTRERFEDRGGDYDLVFDQIGGDVQERSWGVLRKGGRLITIAGEESDAPDQARARALGVTAEFFIVDRNAGELDQLLSLVRSGDVQVVIGKRYDFATIVEAFSGDEEIFAGKAVLSIATDARR